jgi:hypothetical protein
MTAAIFGFFSMSWFGWALEAPPPRWRRPIIAGLIAGGVVCALGVVLAVRNWTGGTVFDESVDRTFGIVVGIEFAAAGIGAGLLGAFKRPAWIPVWIALVVGLHMFPVAALLHYPVIHVVGVLITVAAVAALPVARARELPPSAVVGPLTGVTLLAGALYSLITIPLAF